MLGREDILARLLDALDSPGPLSHQLVIAGPSGIGKTRILEEVSAIGRIRRSSVLALRCAREDALRPLSLVIDFARALLQVRGALGARPTSLEVLRRFAEGQDEGDSAPALSIEDRRAAVYAALADLLEAVSEERDVIVTIDDAQWAEVGSWTVLAPILPRRGSGAVSWVVAIRAESREETLDRFNIIVPPDGAAAQQGREVLWLLPLERASVEALCRARAFPQAVPHDVLSVLVAKAAGIPFFAETLVHHWRATGDVTSTPVTVKRVVHARLDRLTTEGSLVLASIATLDREAEYEALEAVVPLERGQLLRATRELETAGIARTQGGGVTAHALWTEAILQRTPTSTIQLLHRYAARWLESSTNGSGALEPRRMSAVASHWLSAGAPERARQVLDQAATRLSVSGFAAQAAHMMEQAAELAHGSRVGLHYLERAAEYWLIDDTVEALDAVERLHARYNAICLSLDPASFDRHHDTELLALRIRFKMVASITEGPGQLLNCLRATEASARHRLHAASHVLARTWDTLNAAAVDEIWQTVASIPADDHECALLKDLCAAFYYLNFSDDPALGLAHALRAEETISQLPSLEAQCYMRLMLALGRLHERLGSVDSASEVRRRLLARGSALKDAFAVLTALSELIGTSLELGEPASARMYLPQFGRPASPAVSLRDLARFIYWTVCALEEGNVALAREECVVPLEIGLRASDRIARARVLSIYAHIALLENDDMLALQLLPQLLGCFSERSYFMDHPAHVTAMLLARFESSVSAAAFVRHFLEEQRVERWTPRQELTRWLSTGSASVRSAPDSSIASSTGDCR